MRIFNALLVLAPCAVCGCVTEPSVEDMPEGEAPESEPIARCAVPLAPPPADETWRMVEVGTRSAVISNYGTNECDSYVLGLQEMSAFAVALSELPETAEKCTGTTITVLVYRRQGITWSYVGADVGSGVWSGGSCHSPSPGRFLSGDEHRVAVRVNRSTCAGRFCGTTGGIPFKITGLSL